jgi:hypothetical protein
MLIREQDALSVPDLTVFQIAGPIVGFGGFAEWVAFATASTTSRPPLAGIFWGLFI